MAGNSGVWVFYFLQGEDGDSVENPNAFNVPTAANEVRLGQFLQAFPLAGHGQYHFRFRAPDPSCDYCWIDLSDLSAVLPRYDNAICAKALRLDRLPKPRSSRLRRKAPYGKGLGGPTAAGEKSGGSTSWRREQAEQRTAQEASGSGRHGQWQGQSHGRPRSASPGTHHHPQMHGDGRHDPSKGKSVTPPPNFDGRKGAPGKGSPPPPPPPPPPLPPRPENLEDFLFSDSPDGSPTSSPRTRDNGNVQGEAPATRRRTSGGSNSSGSSAGGGAGGSSSHRRDGAREESAGRKSGDDLLNFGGGDSHAAAQGGRSSSTGKPTPGRSTFSGGHNSPPPGWGNRPRGTGTTPAGRNSTAGRMQGDEGGSGAGRGGGAGAGAGAGAAGGVRGNVRSGSNGSSSGSGNAGKSSSSSTQNNGRRASFSGGAGGSPDLMDVKSSSGVARNGSAGRTGATPASTAAGTAAGGARGGAAAKSSYVASKVEEREKDLKSATAKAVQFIKDIDEAASKDQENMDAAKVKHDAKLTAWAEDHGKKRNVRTLLSTMHTVLWEGNRWKTVSMGDIIQPSRVKMSYRKAMLLVHPDKCGSLGPEERLIAKRVFEAVNEAYTIFSEKEMGG